MFLALPLLLVFAAAGAVEDPIEIPAGKDVTIYSSNPNTQWAGEGARATFDLMAKAGDMHRALLYFPLKDEAAKFSCTTAMLRLTAEEIWPNKNKAFIRIHRLLRPFSENGAAWAVADEGEAWINAGGDFDPVASCARKLGRESGKNQTVDIDVTALVQGWQTKQYPNYGCVLTLEDGSETYARFNSKESGANGPQLSLYYLATAPKNPDSMKVEQLQPLGKKPEFKIEITTGSFNASLDKPVQVPFKAQRGVPAYQWKFNGLPDGVSANGNTLSGAPTKAGSYVVSVDVTDAEHHSASKKFTINVTDPSKPAAVVAGIAPGAKPETAKPLPAKKNGPDDE